MKNQGKGTKRLKSVKQEKHFRTKYIDHSRRFLEWVDNLGFEQSPVGRLVRDLDSRFGIRRFSFLMTFTLFLSFFLFADFEIPLTLKAGQVATVDVKSPISFQVIDDVATQEKKIAAEKASPAVFDFYPDVFEGVYDRTYKSFRQMRRRLRTVKWSASRRENAKLLKQISEQKGKFEEELGAKVSQRIFEWLASERFSPHLENMVVECLVNWSHWRIADRPSSVLRPSDETLVVRPIERAGPGDEFTVERGDIKDLSRSNQFALPDVKGLKSLRKVERENLLKFSRSLLVANLTFNRQETEARRKTASEAVLPVQLSVKKNQTVISAGSVVQPIQVSLLREIQNLQSDRRSDFVALVAAVLFLILILVFFSYLRRFTTNKVRVDLKDLLVMGTVTFMVVGITKLFLFMTDAAFMWKYGSILPPTFFLFAAPIAAGPMMVGLLITSGEVVWLFTTFLATVLAVMVDMNFSFLLVSIIGGLAAARGVYGCKKRNDIYWAGLRTGLVNSVTIAFVLVLSQLGDGLLLHDLLWNVPAGFVGGILASLVAMMLIPLLESVFNYTTDVKLLELSNLNHPLMQEMMVRAPGTYHHSLSVGAMVETAATDIEANALLAKVMAYYHDIGKMEHAQYFIENQHTGFNPHDQVSPYMSKTILVAHVKDGAELGIKHKLGKPIVDGVLQHHGTTLISYFYNKALEEQNTDLSQVEESEFRYPGPKPQFKEAALVMLADSIEAAARSLDEPTPSRLAMLVKNIIQNKFIDGQLDECNLTLRDLSVIEDSFKKTLLSIYHHRIDYPHMRLGSPVGVSKDRRKSTTPKGSSSA